jgi:hypothetical protein
MRETLRQRLMALASAMLDHPNVRSIYDLGQSDGIHYPRVAGLVDLAHAPRRQWRRSLRKDRAECRVTMARRPS